MKKAAHPATPPLEGGGKQSPEEYGVIPLLRDITDTTWRLTIPVVLFAGLGIFCDIKLNSTPWLTLLGTAVGFTFGGLLVKRQIARINNNEEVKENDE